MHVASNSTQLTRFSTRGGSFDGSVVHGLALILVPCLTPNATCWTREFYRCDIQDTWRNMPIPFAQPVARHPYSDGGDTPREYRSLSRAAKSTCATEIYCSRTERTGPGPGPRLSPRSAMSSFSEPAADSSSRIFYRTTDTFCSAPLITSVV